MVTDGTYYNGSCCFAFGNAEMQPVAGGYGTVEAIYFGSCDWWDKGTGSGPWIMAELEVGVYGWGGFSAYSDANKNGNKSNPSDLSFSYPFFTAMLKGNSSNATNGGPFTLKGGNAQSGALTTIWDGAYPVGYGSPMQRQGGVVLRVGGEPGSPLRYPALASPGSSGPNSFLPAWHLALHGLSGSTTRTGEGICGRCDWYPAVSLDSQAE